MDIITNREEVFRISSILYADNNYTVDSKLIYKKIIESVLLENNNEPLQLDELVLKCEGLGLILDELEICSIIDSDHSKDFKIIRDQKGMILSLTQDRYNLVLSESENSVEKYISLFIENFPEYKEIDIRDIINKYLYELFETNKNCFLSLSKVDTVATNNHNCDVNYKNYSPQERQIINQFLNWDNPQKNKALFDIVSYGLEYSMISGQKSKLNSRYFKTIINKDFYIDTSIIYRALGLNGENRQKIICTFLKKCVSNRAKLNITKYTNSEFKDSIKLRIKEISKYEHGIVNPSIYKNFNDSIYAFYHKWRYNRPDFSLNLFEGYIISLYKNFLDEFSIFTDNNTPFDEKDNKNIDIINKYYTNIDIHKCAITTGDEKNLAIMHDAANIYWIEMKRNKNVTNILDHKYFLISSDIKLREWDYKRQEGDPVVLYPSQWMCILLRYTGRSPEEDDYKSFISFLNLRQRETIIDDYKLNIIISAISRTTEDLLSQNLIIEALIDENFNSILDKDTQSIYENCITYSMKYLEEELNGMKSEVENTKAELDNTREKLTETGNKLNDLDGKYSSLEDVLNNSNNKLLYNDKKISYLESKYVKDNISKWRRPAYFCFGIAILFLLLIGTFLISFFFFGKNPNSLSNLLIRYLNSILSNTTPVNQGQSQGMTTNSSMSTIISIILFIFNFVLGIITVPCFRVFHKRCLRISAASGH